MLRKILLRLLRGRVIKDESPLMVAFSNVSDYIESQVCRKQAPVSLFTDIMIVQQHLREGGK